MMQLDDGCNAGFNELGPSHASTPSFAEYVSMDGKLPRIWTTDCF